jgi:ABC-type lipoprotein release transport system permease subunit
MILIGVGSAITRYTAIIKEMNVLFNRKIVVVARGVMVIQAFPVGGAIPESVLQEIMGINGVKNATPLLFILNTETCGVIQLIPSNITIGVPPDNWSILTANAPLKKGGHWPLGFADEKAVVGSSIADQNGLSVGSRIKVENHEIEVTGIVDARISILSRAIIMPLKTVQKLYGYIGLVNMIIVEPWEESSIQELSQTIEKEIRNVKALTDDERIDAVKPMLDELEKWNFGIVATLLFLTMCLVLIVTSMNISERKREFAILDAIGASRNVVIGMVAIEAFIIGLVGSLAGLFLGLIAALTIASAYTSIPIQLFIPSIGDLLPMWLVMETLTLTVMVSIFGGVISTVAAQKNFTTEILRAEH